MADNTLFRDHHIWERRTLKIEKASEYNDLLQDLSDAGHFDIDAQRNRIFLPTERSFAAQLGITSHGGRHIAEYQWGIQGYQDILRSSPDYVDFYERGDLSAAPRLAEAIHKNIDFMRVGLADGHLMTNAPLDMKAGDIRPGINSFFGNKQQFISVNAQAIADVPTMSGAEMGWRGVVHSEHKVVATLAEISKPNVKLIRGGDEATARHLFAQAVVDANDASRLTMSERSALQFEQVFGSDFGERLRLPRNQRGFIHPDLLAGELTPIRIARIGGIAASATDAFQTAGRVRTLLEQDNLLGAKNETRDYLVTNASAWGMAWSGSKLGAELGVRRGPGGAIAGGIAGGIVGYTLSDQATTGLDMQEIIQQKDKLGRPWTYNGTEWVQPRAADLSLDGKDDTRITTFSADFDTRQYLDYKASNTAVEAALRRLPPPASPYELAANATDPPSMDDAPWKRDAETGTWGRNRVIGFKPNGGNDYKYDEATPERAAQLNQQAAEVVQANILNGPLPIVARYNAAYRLNGWSTHGESSMAATAALNPDSLRASDGQQYQRGVDGTWRQGNAIANGNVADELNATRTAIIPKIEQHKQVMASLPDWKRPSQDELDMATLARFYKAGGVEPFPETLAAAQVAVVLARERNGLSSADTSIALDPDTTGTKSVRSPIVLLSESGGAVRVAAVITGDEIEQVKQRMQALGKAQDLPTQGAPAMGISLGASRRREQDEVSQDQTPDRTTPQTFPTDHKDYALFLVIQQNLPKGTPDEKTAEVMYAAKEGRIATADEFEKVNFNEKGVYVLGKTWGRHTGTISLTDPAPSLDTTLQKTEELDIKRDKELTVFRQEQAEIAKNPTGPVMTLGMRGPAAPPSAPTGPPDGGGDGGGGGGGGDG